MSIEATKVYVIRIYAKGSTYYLSQRDGVTLDYEDYLPLLVSMSDIEKIGNFGEGTQAGTCHAVVVNGEARSQGAIIFDMTDVWNNRKCDVRLCTVGTHTTWAACAKVYSGIIKNFTFQQDKMEFDIDDKDFREDAILPRQTIEEFVGAEDIEYIPENSRGKRVPIQYGDLTDIDSAIFAKGILASQRIGGQYVLFDSRAVQQIDTIGVWESGYSAYFAALKASGGVEFGKTYLEGEYETNATTARADFKINSLCIVSVLITATSGLMTIQVSDWTKLSWSDETEEPRWVTTPKVLGANIIGIGSELLLMVEKPTTNTIWVERGYAGTTPAAHAVNDEVYQSSRYASRNLLVFWRAFRPVFSTNHFAYSWAQVTDGSWNDLDTGSDTEFIEFTATGGGTHVSYQQFQHTDAYAQFNCDIKFRDAKLDGEYSIRDIYVGMKATQRLTIEKDGVNTGSLDLRSSICLCDPSDAYTVRNQKSTSPIVNRFILSRAQLFTGCGEPDFTETNVDVDTLQVFSNAYKVNDGEDGIGAETNNFNLLSDVMSISNPAFKYASKFVVSSLGDLSNKWKFLFEARTMEDTFGFPVTGDWQYYDTEIVIRIYKLLFWIRFYTDLVERKICAPLIGREASYTLWGVQPDVSNPSALLMDILTIEGNYIFNEIDSASFIAIRTYQITAAAYSGGVVPVCAMSYGGAESEKLFVLCQTIALQFLMTLLHTAEGKIIALNLHKLQSNDATYGYPSMTAYKISLDDVLMGGDQRRITVQQTGTDRIRNSVVVKYARNNSTDEYTQVYPPAGYDQDAFVLTESLITLAQARLDYYNGSKTETLEIECLAIYNEDDARRLWEWHINDKAEIFFWAEAVISAEQYIVAGKSAQYFPGDVIYFDGVYSGVTFDATHKWIVRETVLSASGRDITIRAKSIQPINSFTSSAVGQNLTVQVDPAETDIIDDDPGATDDVYVKV